MKRTPKDPITTIADVQQVVECHFPQYWPAVKAGLATIATLLLEDNANPATLFYYGPPSSGKTTVVEILSRSPHHPITYRSDNFTPASFVSHKADVAEKKLTEIDLLPRIKHKCLLTPEMAPIFSGKEDVLHTRLATMTRVLDGQGLWTDTGAHGGRGYKGDYLFCWIGATVPLKGRVWDLMGHMGSRLLFWPMPDGPTLTPDELVGANEGPSYRSRVEECQKVVFSFLYGFLGPEPAKAVRSVVWEEESKEFRQEIACLASLLAALRSKEAALRPNAMLYNFARGHALLFGRRSLDWDDLPLTGQLAIGSIPEDRRKVFSALIRCRGVLPGEAIQEVLGWGKTKTYGTLDAFDGEVIELADHPVKHLRLRDEWRWTLALADLVGGPYQGETLGRMLGSLIDPKKGLIGPLPEISAESTNDD